LADRLVSGKLIPVAGISALRQESPEKPEVSATSSGFFVDTGFDQWRET